MFVGFMFIRRIVDIEVERMEALPLLLAAIAAGAILLIFLGLASTPSVTPSRPA